MNIFSWETRMISCPEHRNVALLNTTRTQLPKADQMQIPIVDHATIAFFIDGILERGVVVPSLQRIVGRLPSSDTERQDHLFMGSTGEGDPRNKLCLTNSGKARKFVRLQASCRQLLEIPQILRSRQPCRGVLRKDIFFFLHAPRVLFCEQAIGCVHVHARHAEEIHLVGRGYRCCEARGSRRKPSSSEHLVCVLLAMSPRLSLCACCLCGRRKIICFTCMNEIVTCSRMLFEKIVP